MARLMSFFVMKENWDMMENARNRRLDQIVLGYVINSLAECEIVMAGQE